MHQDQPLPRWFPVPEPLIPFSGAREPLLGSVRGEDGQRVYRQHKSCVHGLMGWRKPCIMALQHLQGFLVPFSTFGPRYIHSAALMRRGPISGNCFAAETTGLRLPAHFTYRWAPQSHGLVMAFSQHLGGRQQPSAGGRVVCYSPLHHPPNPNSTPLCRGHPGWETESVHSGSSRGFAEVLLAQSAQRGVPALILQRAEE